MEQPGWLKEYREEIKSQGPFHSRPVSEFRMVPVDEPLDHGMSSHRTNDGSHVSPYDEGMVLWGTDGIQVNLLQSVDEAQLKKVLSRTLRATTGISPGEVTNEDEDAVEMFSGGLQAALESQVVVFEIIGASRALTHQLVRTRKAAYHQQSQRATWYGDQPNVRFPESVIHASDRYDAHGIDVKLKWTKALLACWEAYKAACDAGMPYEDARYILPEGTTNYIICEYPLREFLNVYAYRACYGFAWEMHTTMRKMGEALMRANPFLEPYIKVSCEKGGPACPSCGGSGRHEKVGNVSCPACLGKGYLGSNKCTFQGWENVEAFCSLPWAKQSNRVFLPNPKYRIEAKK